MTLIIIIIIIIISSSSSSNNNNNNNNSAVLVRVMMITPLRASIRALCAFELSFVGTGP